MQSGRIQVAQPLPPPLASVPTPELPKFAARLKWPFWGPNGLRALWRLLIFVAIVFGLRIPVNRLLPVDGGIKEFTARAVLLQDGVAFLILLAASAIMGVFEKRSLAVYGLPLREAFRVRFFEGILWGFVAECATMLTLYLTGNVTFHGLDQRGTSALYFGVLWAAAFLMVGFFEEMLFRGYPQFTLASGIGFWPAAIVLSGLFWRAHMGNPGETWIGGLAAALAALLFCASLRLTGNLWFPIGMHASWDWAETFFFGVPDSGMPATGHLLNTTLSGNKWMTGGTVGPEGSVVELLLVSAVIGLLFVRFRRASERLTVASLR
jgi:membrane protease YdiL (CAAX protease family)